LTMDRYLFRAIFPPVQSDSWYVQRRTASATEWKISRCRDCEKVERY
jgi:hypothetical protein